MGTLDFIWKTSFFSGRLPGLIASYASFLVLGFTPIALIFFKGMYFQNLSLSHRGLFITANLFYIACIIARVSYDIYICRRASRFANTQANITHKIFLNSLRQGILDDSVRYNKENKHKEAKKIAGDHILDNSEVVYNSMNTFIQSLLQSFFSVLSTMFTVYWLGYGKLGALACCIAASIIYINYTLQKQYVANQQRKVKNIRATTRNMIQQKVEKLDIPNHEDVAQLNKYTKESNRLLDYDAIRNWTYIFIKYTSESIIMLCAVLWLTTSFPLEQNTIAGSVLTATMLFNLAGVLASTIMDSSAIIRDFDKMAHAISSYQNVSSQIKAQGVSSELFVKRHAETLKQDFGDNYSRAYIWRQDVIPMMSQSLVSLFITLGLGALMIETGLISRTLPFGLRAIQYGVLSGASTLLGHLVRRPEKRQKSYQNDRIFLGFTLGVITSLTVQLTFQPGIAGLSVCFLITSMLANAVATSYFMPSRWEIAQVGSDCVTVRLKEQAVMASSSAEYEKGLNKNSALSP